MRTDAQLEAGLEKIFSDERLVVHVGGDGSAHLLSIRLGVLRRPKRGTGPLRLGHAFNHWEHAARADHHESADAIGPRQGHFGGCSPRVGVTHQADLVEDAEYVQPGPEETLDARLGEIVAEIGAPIAGQVQRQHAQAIVSDGLHVSPPHVG